MRSDEEHLNRNFESVEDTLFRFKNQYTIFDQLVNSFKCMQSVWIGFMPRAGL